MTRSTGIHKSRRGRGGRRGHSAKHHKPSPPPFLADEAFDLLVAEYDFNTVLDVGCGDGSHARALHARGKRVTTVSFEAYGGFQPDFTGEFLDYHAPERFDLVWCSHALEHQPNVGLFLQHLARCAAPNGLMAVTVPTARRRIVGGHLTVWNTGLLLYNMIVAGMDCSQARTKEYGYNVSVITRVRPIVLPCLRHDKGDIERLAPYFPMPVVHGFDGRIEEIRWSSPRAPLHGDRIPPARSP
jgi:SAM-dependent methyltransferase